MSYFIPLMFYNVENSHNKENPMSQYVSKPLTGTALVLVAKVMCMFW